MFRKAVLLIHGFVGGTYDLEHLFFRAQVEPKLDVFTFTLPGHEDSLILNAKKDDWISASEAKIEYLIAHGYHNIYVVGHSMGGVIATHLANKYQEIKKVVLLSPAFKYFEFGDKKGLLKSVQKAPEILKGYEKSSVISRFMKVPVPVLISFMELVSEHYNDTKKLTQPLLIMHGDKDKIAPKTSTDYVYQTALSKYKLYYNIASVNHAILDNDRKDEICDIILDFFKQKFYVNKIEEKRI